jgi:hypothetical protein
MKLDYIYQGIYIIMFSKKFNLVVLPAGRRVCVFFARVFRDFDLDFWFPLFLYYSIIYTA